MQLTGKLKEKVSKAETKEQAKELIANAGNGILTLVIFPPKA